MISKGRKYIQFVMIGTAALLFSTCQKLPNVSNQKGFRDTKKKENSVVSLTSLRTPLNLSSNGNQYGASANPTGNPIGGGPGYDMIFSQSNADYVVSTKNELLSALSSAKSGGDFYTWL